MKKYDFIFGTGGSCRCSMGLREAGLQLLSFPYDWNPGPDFVCRCEYLADGFPNWIDRDLLELTNPEEKENHLHYRNVKTGFTFIHDFHAKHIFDEQYPLVKERYERRIARFFNQIERSSKILVIWVNVVDDPYQLDVIGAAKGREFLRCRWPNKQIDVLVMNYKEGIPFAQAESEENDGIRVVSFDYKDRSPGEDTWMADQYILGKWFKKEYCVPDYRTPEEIAAWKKKEANYEYDRWCAKNVFEWMRNKIEYKLYVHLRKQLKKRGLI